MKFKIWLFSAMLPGLFAACIQEFPMTNSPCPCAEGYRCCTHVTGEDVCVREGKHCPCEEVVCIESPLPECLDDQVLRYFKTPGTCSLGKCSYEPLDCTCAAGCQDNFCISEPACSGEMSWAVQAGGSGSASGSDVEAFPDGSFLVVGTYDHSVTFGRNESNQVTLTRTPDGGINIFTAKYNSDGTIAWVVEATGTDANSINSVAGREDGSFYVTGQFGGTITFGPGEDNETSLNRVNCCDAFVALHNPDGTLAWVKTIGGHENGMRNGTSVATLADGSAVVTGFFDLEATFAAQEPDPVTLQSAGSHDIFVARYNPDGSLAWARQAGGISEDQGTAATVDSDDYIFIAGGFGGYDGDPATFGGGEPYETRLRSEGQEDVFIAKYDPDGVLVWAKSAGGDQRDVAGEIAVSGDGTILVTGEGGSPAFGGGPGNIFMATFESSGDMHWSTRIGGEGSSEFGGMSAMSDGSFIITGSFQESITFGDGDANDTVLSAPPGETGHFIARCFIYGEAVWALLSGGPVRGVSTLKNGTALFTGNFQETAVFGRGTANEQSLVASGSSDLFVASYDCPCFVDPRPVPIMGRLWVAPNPIRFHLPSRCIDPTQCEIYSRVSVASAGSEDVVIDKIYLVGDPHYDFRHDPGDYQSSSKIPDFRFPHVEEMDNESGGGITFAIRYQEVTTEIPEANLVIVTSDPTSPSLTIPIIPTGGMIHDTPYDEGHLVVRPNPIRLDPLPPGDSQSVRIDVLAQSIYEIRNVRFTARGNDFSIKEITDYMGNRLTQPFDIGPTQACSFMLEYKSQDDQPKNGTVLINFTDNYGLTQTFIVPIIVSNSAPEARSVFLHFEDDFLDLETGRIEESTIPHNPDFPEWDVKVSYNAVWAVHSVVIQNQESGTEIAHLEGYSFESVTETDASNAVFTNYLMDVPFDGNRVILIRAAAGGIYKLGNPVEVDLGLKFDYAPLH